MKKNLLTLLAVCAICLAVSSLRVKKTTGEDGGYVASTSWVAAIAQLAGIDNASIIAPANIKHPPEYEITPDDMAKVAKAKLFMHAGYEKMMKTISKAAGIPEEKIVKVKTTNTLENLRKMTDMLSQKSGISDRSRFGKYEKMIMEARERVSKSPNSDIAVFANKNQAEFAADIGLNVVSTFGPGPMTAQQIAEVASGKYRLIIDNAHNPAATVTEGNTVIIWRNFPEKMEEDSLYKVMEHNLRLLYATNIL